MKNTLIIVLLFIASSSSFAKDYAFVYVFVPTTNYRGTIVALSLFVVVLLSLIYFVRGRNK